MLIKLQTQKNKKNQKMFHIMSSKTTNQNFQRSICHHFLPLICTNYPNVDDYKQKDNNVIAMSIKDEQVDVAYNCLFT